MKQYHTSAYPLEVLQKATFDPELNYVKNWVVEYGNANYARPIVVHEAIREQATELCSSGSENGRNDERTRSSNAT